MRWPATWAQLKFTVQPKAKYPTGGMPARYLPPDILASYPGTHRTDSGEQTDQDGPAASPCRYLSGAEVLLRRLFLFLLPVFVGPFGAAIGVALTDHLAQLV